MDTKCKCCCHGHDGDRDCGTVHVDRSTERDCYRISITVKSHIFTDLHIDRNVGCGTSGEECGQRTSLQTVEDQRVWILADTPVNQKRVSHKVDKEHTSYQQSKQFSVSSEDLQTVCGYSVEYKTEDTERSHVDDPGNNSRCSVCDIIQYIFGHVICCTECKSEKNRPRKDADVVGIYKGGIPGWQPHLKEGCLTLQRCPVVRLRL